MVADTTMKPVMTAILETQTHCDNKNAYAHAIYFEHDRWCGMKYCYEGAPYLDPA